jgi:hypothetical protein
MKYTFDIIFVSFEKINGAGFIKKARQIIQHYNDENRD